MKSLHFFRQQPGGWAILAAAFVLGVSLSFVSPYLSLWALQHVGFSPAGFSGFMGATTLSGILCGLAAGRWSDRTGHRRAALFLGAVGGVLGYLCYAFSRNEAALLLAGCTALALATGCFAQLFAYVRTVADRIGGRDAGPALSLVRVCFSFAWTGGPALGGWLLAAQGFRGLFIGAAALNVLLAVLIARLPALPRTTLDAATRPARSGAWLPSGTIAPFLAFALIFAAMFANLLNLPLLFTETLGGDRARLGVVFGVGPLVEIPLMVWFGRLATHGHMMALIRLGGISAAAYFAALALAQTPGHVYAAQVVAGFCWAIIGNVAILYFQELLPTQPGYATALFAAASSAGNLVGFVGFGYALLAWGTHGTLLACLALSLGACALLLRRSANASAH